MILFEEDWSRYPNAIADLQTKNQSFVRMAMVYREMGISNHMFMLALHNPALQGVDPFDYENLTLEMQGMIAMECKENPWYFFRECGRAPVQGSHIPAMVEANRGNLCLWWCFFNHIFIILIQIRQTGKSFSTDLLWALCLNVLCEHTTINLMTKDDTLRKENIDRLKNIMLDLPRYLDLRGRDDSNNTEGITVNRRDNKYKAHVPQMQEKRAYNMGRGMTSPIFQIDEGPFQPNIRVALPAALAATTAAVTSAIENNTPYGTVMTTTAGKINDSDGGYVYGLVEESATWTERFLDCQNREELERYVRGASRGADGQSYYQVCATFNHIQLGKSDKWLYETMQRVKVKGEDADRDFFNRWTAGSKAMPFDVELAEIARKSVIEPLYTDISKSDPANGVPGGYLTRWYIPEYQIERRMQSGKFIMGMDTSNASSGDDISLVLVDVETGETIAAGTYNNTNLTPFFRWVASILVTYKNITAIIENRSTGSALLDALIWILPQHGEDPFKRLFNRVVNDHMEYPERFREINLHVGRRPHDINVKYRKHFGFATSASGLTSRDSLYSETLRNALQKAAGKMRDAKIVDQTLSLEDRDGRIDHPKGKHDDMVIGWLLCHWLMTKGTNLAFYGIDSRMVLQKAALAKPLTPSEQYQKQQQTKLRQEIEALVTRLGRESDEYLCARLEHTLKSLSRQVVETEADTASIDELIRQTREARKQRKRGAGFQKNVSVYQELNYASQGHSGEFSDRPMSANDIYRKRYA
ncbi:MAG: hypothetical protein P4L77_11205 [Sulfuriferula sp.]|nr:hypothetical protein [Sulfuriferula sp.]